MRKFSPPGTAQPPDSADIVRAYIETGETRVFARHLEGFFEESLSTATIRSVHGGPGGCRVSVSPHTSGRARADSGGVSFFFAQEIASQATITAVDREWIQRNGWRTSAAKSPNAPTRARRSVQRPSALSFSPPLGKTVMEHARMWLLPDGRVVVVLISPGGNTRDKILRPKRLFTQSSWTQPPTFESPLLRLDAGSHPRTDLLKSSHGARSLRRHAQKRSDAVRPCGVGG